MTEHARQLIPLEEGPLPGSEELASATDLMLALTRASKGLRIYLPNNPVLIKFLEELSGKVTAHISRFGDVELEVEPFALRYKGTPVYENRDAKDSISFRIHSDGIRALLFREGVERRELAVFLGIVSFDSSHQDDDIVTQLWERSLAHISYVLEEDLGEFEIEAETEGVSQQEAITRIYRAVAGITPPPARVIPKHLLMLTRDEATWLRRAKQAEVHRNCASDVAGIVSSVISGTSDHQLFTEFVEIMARLSVNMLYSGEFGNALGVIRFLHQALGHAVTPERRQVLRQALTGILSDGAVQILQETMDCGETVNHEDLRELLLILGLPCLAGICELLGRVEKLKMRKVIIEVLVELGREKPEVFAPYLSDSRWYLVRNMVLVLSLLETPAALEMIVGLISHREQRIRKEVLGFLERSPDPKAKTYILKYLRDDSSALRIRALQILSRERLSFAFKPAVALTATDDFKAMDLAEKKAVYEAIGELGAEQAIPIFREMLLKRRWFQRAVDKETAICALAGLLKVRNAASLKLLEEARSQRGAEIRGLIDEAIAVMSGQRAARGVQGGLDRGGSAALTA